MKTSFLVGSAVNPRPPIFAIALIVLSVAVLAPLQAQDPFRTPGASSADSEDSGGQGDGVSAEVPAESAAQGSAAPASGTRQIVRLPRFFLDWSRRLQQGISDYSRRMGEDPGAGLLSFLLAIVFGMLHVIGPGHGKLFTFSYVGSRQARVSEGLLLSAGINIVDSLSAAALVFGGYGLLSLSFSRISGELTHVLQIISYSLILLFSGGHLLMHLWHHRRGHQHQHDHRHDDHGSEPVQEHGHSQGHASGAGGRRLPPWLLALSVGIIPCPVSTVLFLFGISNGLVLHSVLLVAGVSLGGFFSMGLLTTGLIRGRDVLVKRLSGGWTGVLAEILEFAGLAAMMVFALLLLLPLL